MESDYPHNPHDVFAAALLRIPQHVKRLLRLLLPPELQILLDLRRLQLCNELLIDHELRRKHVDGLYQIPMRGRLRRRVYVYVLFEHKSWPDPFTALQVITYIISLMQHQRRVHQPFGIVIPIVLYHGSVPWQVPLNLRQLVAAPESLERFVPDHDVLVLDLPRADDRFFRGPVDYVARLRTLVASQLSAQLPRDVQEIMGMISRSKRGKSWNWPLVRDIMRYTVAIAGPEQALDLKSAVIDGLQFRSEEEMRSAMDVWIQEWREDRLKRGIGPDPWEIEAEARGEARGAEMGEKRALQQQILSCQTMLQQSAADGDELDAMSLEQLRQRAAELLQRLVAGAAGRH